MNPPTQPQEAIAASLIRAVEATASRRAAPRLSLTTEVDLSSETNFFCGFSTDIATGGLFIATFRLLPIGTALAVRFTLPNEVEISAECQVQWVRALNEADPQAQPGMGLRFVELSNPARTAIDEFIGSREPMFFPD